MCETGSGRRSCYNIKLFLTTLLASLICGCISLPEVAVPKQSDTFSFVAIGDNRPHPNWKDKYTQPRIFRRAIDEINLLDPDFTVLIGDLILGYSEDKAQLAGMWDCFDAAVNKFKSPYYQVIGNHDVSNAVMEQIYTERYGKRFPLYYSFNHRNCHFIILNSDLHGEYKYIKGQQFAWLKKDLFRNKNSRKIFVFLHQPLWLNKPEESNWMKDIHPLMAQYKVDTVFAGHHHLYRKNATLDGVRYIITGGAGAELRTPEYMGGFFHYCVVTVRENDISLAVVKTGHIENEDAVNDSHYERANSLTGLLRPIKLRLKRGTSKLPGRKNFVIPNPFNEKLTGNLTWEVPEKSPWWQMPSSKIHISLKAGEKQSIPISLPQTGSADNIEALEPFPVAVWNLSVGGKTLCENVKSELVLDRWPYSEIMSELEKEASLENTAKIVPKTPTVLQIPVKNPTKWRKCVKMSWFFLGNANWKISPVLETVDLMPGEERITNFDVSFSGSPDEVFPLPKLDFEIELDSEKVLKTSTRFPVDMKDFFSQKTRTGRCIKVKTGPAIDGKLNDSSWNECDVLRDFLLLEAVGEPAFSTEAKFCYDNDNLYMSFRCFDSKLLGLVAKAKKHDEDAWADDSVEVLLDTNLDKKTYFHFAFNANAVVYDASNSDRRWNGQCTVKTGRKKNAWTLEAAIPWKSIGMTTPKAGDKIGLEIARTHARKPYEISQWNPTLGNNHIPSRFGVLVFE